MNARLRAADGRLHAWLRIVIVLVAVSLAALLATVPQVLLAPPLGTLAHAAVMLVVIVGGFAWLAPRLDRRRITSYGLAADRRWWLDLVAGLGIGLLIALVALGVLLTGGWGEVVEMWSPGAAEAAVGVALAAGVVSTAVVALWEELVFRGYLVSNAAEALAARRPPRRSVVIASVISMLVFALLHAGDLAAPGTAPVAVGVVHLLAMGALFAAAYIFTGQLALAIGVHFGWNVGAHHLIGLFGPLAENSALAVRLELDGPAWLVGASGVAQLVGALVGFLALWLWLRLRPGDTTVDPRLARPQHDELSLAGSRATPDQHARGA